jgi:G:T/U-mismatch repair DNA glycosylase
MARKEIAELLVRLDAQTQELNAGLSSARRELREFDRNVERDLGSIRNRFERTGEVIRKSMLIFSAAGGVAGLQQGVRNIVGDAAALQDTADQIGVNVEALQRLRFVASQNGSSARELDDALRRLTRRAGLFAQDGGGPAAKAIEELGLQVTDASGKVRSAEAIFYDAVSAMESVESQAELSALASQLFGEDAGPKLLQVLRLGIQGMQESAAEAEVLREEMTRAAQEINDDFDALIDTISVRFKSAVLETVSAVRQISLTGDSYIFDPRKLEENRAQVKALEQQLAALDMPAGRARTRAQQEIQAQIDARRALDPQARLREIDREVERLQRGGSGQMGRASQSAIARLEEEARELRAELEKARLELESIEGAAAAGGERTRGQAAKRLISQVTGEEVDSGDFTATIRGGAEESKAAAAAKDEQAEATWRALRASEKHREALAQEAETIRNQVLLPVERYVAEVRRLNELRAAGVISELEHQRAVAEAKETYEGAARAAETLAKESGAADEAAKALGDDLRTIGTIAADGFGRAVLEARSLSEAVQDVSRRLAELAIDRSTNALFGALFNTGGSLLSGLFSGGGSAGSGVVTTAATVGIPASMRAGGGPVRAGMPYVVGEKRPEIFVPRSDGTILPDAGAVGRGEVNVTVNNYGDSQVEVRESRRADGGADLEIMVDRAAARAVNRPASQTGRALRGTYGASRRLTGRA